MGEDLGVGESQGERCAVPGGAGDLVLLPDSQVPEALVQLGGPCGDDLFEP